MAKVLPACVMEDLVHAAKMQNLLPSNHFGCHPGRTTSDSLHYITTFVKNTWRKKEVISALFLDIKGVFPNVVLNQLIHDMRTRGVPPQYTDWIAHKVSSRWMTLKFDSYELEPLSMIKGIDQGCPLSGIAYQFYSSDLVDIHDTDSGEDAIMFMDDMLLLAWAKTLAESNTKVKCMMVRQDGGLDWEMAHQSDFALDKFRIMGLTRRREQNPLGNPKIRPAFMIRSPG